NYFTYKFNINKVSNQLLLGYDFISSAVNLNQQYYELPGQFGAGSGIVGTFSLKNPQYTTGTVKAYQLSDFENDGSGVDGTVFRTQGVYLQNQISYNKWKMLFSLREEFYKRDYSTGSIKLNTLLPRFGIVYALETNINAYITYNNGFDPYEASASVQVFNAPFKPVTSQLLETGVKGNFFSNKLAASVAIYQLTLQNVAVNANDISNPNLFVQQGEDRSGGIEAEATGNILANLSVTLSYAYCDARVIKSKIPSQTGAQVENSPRNSGNSWINYTFNKGYIKGFGVSAGYSFAGARNTLDPNIVLPGYFIIKAGIHYKYNHFTVAANVNNITNQTYWTGAYNNVYKWPGEPRNYMVNLGYAF
ncbi:MAG: TonB-dependent siderophore receptor, partial [Sphingobacteriales bacterium]